MKFSDIHRQLIQDLKAGMLKVEPLSYKRTVLQLKKQVLSVSDQQKEKQENTKNVEPEAETKDSD